LNFENVEKMIHKWIRTLIEFVKIFEDLKISMTRQHNIINMKENNVVHKFTIGLLPGPRVKGALKVKRGH